MLRVDKADIPILIYLWEHDEYMRNPFALSENLYLGYNYICNRIGILLRRGVIKKIVRGKRSYYTKPLKGYMYEVMRQVTNLSMRKCVIGFNKYWSNKE